MTTMLDRAIPSSRSAMTASSNALRESASTTLEIWPIVDGRRVAGLVMLLHRLGMSEVSFEPQTGGRYLFETAIPSEELLAAFLDSNEFRPTSLRSFASGRLEVCLAS